jgi:hypothetical protein
MIAYSYIENNLILLDARYRRSRSIKDANFASKLAILELCGWIEVSLDDCIERASQRVLKDAANRRFIKEKILRNYGFEYERHFKSMLVHLIGIWGFEIIFRRVDTAVSLNFINELNALKIRRNSLAHTYTRGVTPHYDAPSITIARFANLKSGFAAFDGELRKYCP